MSRQLVFAALLAGTAAQAPSNPFCGYDYERNEDCLLLSCASGVISAINFADYGTPSGSCPNFAVNASCSAPTSQAFVEAACLNQTECYVCAGDNDTPPDPCPGTVKALAVVASCSEAPGGSALPLVQSCATTEGTPPCPLPTWEPTWKLSKSTIAQPGNTAGFLNATEAAKWGLVSLDWSIANRIWLNGSAANATGASTLVEQCRQIKAVDPTTKCFVYRNTELALEWLEPQRAVMYDEAFADLFLQYQPGNPDGAPPGTIYNEPAGAPCPGCAQFFWNYSNPDTVEYVLGVSEQGALGTASPYVDGTFLDDSQAIPQEHPNAPTRLGLKPVQLALLRNATHAFVQRAIGTLAAAGKYIWQGFNNNPGGDPDAVAPGPNAQTCATYMAATCDPSWASVPMTMQWDPSAANQTVAAFLIVRGPYAYVGYGWNGQALPAWDSAWDADYGVPLAPCAQVSPGVYSRSWAAGDVTLDCNTWTATLPPSL